MCRSSHHQSSWDKPSSLYSKYTSVLALVSGYLRKGWFVLVASPQGLVYWARLDWQQSVRMLQLQQWLYRQSWGQSLYHVIAKLSHVGVRQAHISLPFHPLSMVVPLVWWNLRTAFKQGLHELLWIYLQNVTAVRKTSPSLLSMLAKMEETSLQDMMKSPLNFPVYHGHQTKRRKSRTSNPKWLLYHYVWNQWYSWKKW